jgi:hypothetical protein
MMDFPKNNAKTWSAKSVCAKARSNFGLML